MPEEIELTAQPEKRSAKAGKRASTEKWVDIVPEALAAETAQRIVALKDFGRGLFTVLEAKQDRIRPMPQ